MSIDHLSFSEVLFIPHFKVNLLMTEMLQAAPSVRGLGLFEVNQKLFPTVQIETSISQSEIMFLFYCTAYWNCIDICYNFMPMPCFGAAICYLNNWPRKDSVILNSNSFAYKSKIGSSLMFLPNVSFTPIIGASSNFSWPSPS